MSYYRRVILLLSLLTLGPLLAIALYNSRTAPRLRDYANFVSEDARAAPKVSVLVAVTGSEVPARLMRGLNRIEYPDLEILFWSAEETANREIDDYIGQNAHARRVTSAPVPADWRAENWASHQLVQSASGTLLIFCDSSLSIGAESISHVVRAREATGADCLGLVPRAIRGSLFERALVPFTREIPLAGLFVLKRQPALPLSPECLVIERGVYASIGGHASVPQSPVANGALMHRARLYVKTVTLLATEQFSVHQARCFKQVWRDLADSLYLLAGGREVTLLGLIGLHIVAFILPWLALVLPWSGASASCVLLLAFRLAAASLFAGPGFDVFSHPLGAFLVPALAVDSARGARRSLGKLTEVRSAHVSTEGA